MRAEAWVCCLLGLTGACSTSSSGSKSNADLRAEDAGGDASEIPESCADDASCGEGKLCSAQHTCIAAGTCVGDGDCRGENQFCSVARVCVAQGGCADTGDCRDGYTCDVDAQACVPGGCEEQSFAVEAVPPNLQIVLDRSCSMRNADKWPAAVKAVTELTTKFEALARWGLALFPDPDANKCGQTAPQIPLADANEANIQMLLDAALNKKHELYPDNPCVTNIADTLSMVSGLQALKDAQRANRVLLITDGAEFGCGTAAERDKESVATLEAMAKAGVSTYVVGFGDGTDRTAMNNLAKAGGVPRNDPQLAYYQADDPAALESALKEIVASVVGCDFALDKAPDDLARVHVFLGTDELARDASHASGWDYEDTTHTLHLFGDACDKVRAGDQSALKVVVSCFYR